MPGRIHKSLEVVNLRGGLPRVIPLTPEAIEVLNLEGDPAVAKIATLQHGGIAYWQLRQVGLSDRQIRGRQSHHLLNAVFRSVYLVGHTATTDRTLPTAALLAAGPQAVLSFHTAGHLGGFRSPRDGVVDITHPARRTSRPGLRYHSRALHPTETHFLDGLPLTSPARTVVDLATVLPRRELPRLVGNVLRETTTIRTDILDAIQRAGPLRGLKHLTTILQTPDNIERTRSETEAKLQRLLRQANLPIPETNAHVAGHEYDFVWPNHHLIAEFDPWLYHAQPDRFANDRSKHNAAQRAGFTIFRFTDPLQLVLEVAKHLDHRLAA